MAWRRPGDKPLSEPMMVSLPTHICVTRPQWVTLRINDYMDWLKNKSVNEWIGGQNNESANKEGTDERMNDGMNEWMNGVVQLRGSMFPVSQHRCWVIFTGDLMMGIGASMWSKINWRGLCTCIISRCVFLQAYVDDISRNMLCIFCLVYYE